MKKNIIRSKLLVLLSAVLVLSCCQETTYDEFPDKTIPETDLEILRYIGLDTSDVTEYKGNYIIDGDIVVSKEELPLYVQNPQSRQARYQYIIKQDKQRSVVIKIDSSTPASWHDGVREAVDAWNDMGCNVRMSLTTGSVYDIIVRKGTGLTGVAQAQYPLSSGAPGSFIEVNESYNYYSTDQKKYVIVHELGHNLGFAHSNWTISGNVTGIQIPGTPASSATNADITNSVMYSNSGGRYWSMTGGFTHYDKVAAHYVYPNQRGWSYDNGNYIYRFSKDVKAGGYTFNVKATLYKNASDSGVLTTSIKSPDCETEEGIIIRPYGLKNCSFNGTTFLYTVEVITEFAVQRPNLPPLIQLIPLVAPFSDTISGF